MTLLLVLACASAPAPTAAPHVPAPVAAAPAPAPAASGVPDPLAGKTLEQICSSDLVLLKWEYDDLQQHFAERCCVEGGLGADAMDCELDWPFSDVPHCDAYDQMRNAIFAYYGYVFSKPEYREQFGKEPWYAPREDFDAGWLTPVAKKNVETLKRLRRERVACMEYPQE